VDGLSAEDLGPLLPLLKGADSFELKLTIPESERRLALAALPAQVQDLGGRVRPLGGGRDVVLLGQLRILELSTKCPPSQAFLAVAEFRAMLGRARHRLER
jgi:hypothetical protein